MPDHPPENPLVPDSARRVAPHNRMPDPPSQAELDEIKAALAALKVKLRPFAPTEAQNAKPGTARYLKQAMGNVIQCGAWLDKIELS